jgi:hypothetical protein
MTQIKLGAVSLDARDYASQGNAILGIRDSGKSYAASYIAERLMDAHIPIVVFDPIGVWRFLRVEGSGAGYPVVVAGGEHGDLPLTPKSAPEIVRAAMREGISLVIDLYSMELSKADWRRIVEASVKVLLFENKASGLRHVFIEEAAEFAPQIVRPDQGAVYDVMERLSRMGGNALLGYTLINQRAEQVNKAILENCDSLFLFRQKGRNSLTALSKWMTIADAKGGAAVAGSLPTLGQGDCWAWVSGSDTPVKIHIPSKRTFHPDRRAMHAKGNAAAHKTANVSAFVAQLSGSLEAIVAESKANDPAELKKEIAALRKQISTSGMVEKINTPDPAAIERARAQGECDGWDLAVRQGAEVWLTRLPGFQASLDGVADAIRTLSEQRPPSDFPPLPRPRPAPPSAAKGRLAPSARTTPIDRPPRGAPQAGLKPSLQRVLDAIAWWRKIGTEPVARDRACVTAGFSPKASTFNVYIGELGELGLVETSPGKVRLTAAGLGQANTPAATTPEDLFQVSRGMLKPQEARVFDAIYERYPEEISRRELAEVVGLSPTASTLNVYIGGVAAYGIVETTSPGHVKAADWLFP